MLTYKLHSGHNYWGYGYRNPQYTYLLEVVSKENDFKKIDLSFSAALQPNRGFLSKFDHYSNVCEEMIDGKLVAYTGCQIFATIEEKKELTVKTLQFEDEISNGYIELDIELSDGQTKTTLVYVGNDFNL